MAIRTKYKQLDLLLFEEQTERLVFKEVTAAHKREWLEFCAYPGSLDYIGLHEYPTPEEKCAAWFNRVQFRYENQLGGMNALIEKSSGRLVGQLGLLVQEIDGERFLELGYSLHPAFRGKGFATEASTIAIDRAKKIAVSDELISMIHVENDASMHVAERNGMTRWKQIEKEGDPLYLYRLIL